MHILIGLGLALALLYFWLVGHWFARVLVFIGLAIGGGFVLAVLMPVGPKDDLNPLGFLIGIAAAWPLAGIPTYYWRHQQRKQAAQIRRGLEMLNPGDRYPLIAPSRRC
jgi:hypothetical protein